MNTSSRKLLTSIKIEDSDSGNAGCLDLGDFFAILNHLRRQVQPGAAHPQNHPQAVGATEQDAARLCKAVPPRAWAPGAYLAFHEKEELGTLPN